MSMLPERLRKLRKEQGLTQEEAANGAGLVLRSYRRYEMGEREPVASTLILLADFLIRKLFSNDSIRERSCESR